MMYINTRKWLKSHHDTLFPFFPYFKKESINWLFDRLGELGGEEGALYIHIPFCTGRCTFCILTKEYPSGNTQKYVNSILEEAKEWRDHFSPVETIYVGGGTPTSLSSEELKLLFNGLGEIFQIEKDAEISIETTASELTTEGMFWANTIGAEMAREYLYNGKAKRGELVSLLEKSSKIAKEIMLDKIRSK